MTTLSIIVVNYNGGNLVKRCLGSIFGQKASFAYECIVVDNASTDGSCKDILSKFPQVRLIANKSNLGFSRANNQAIKISSSPYILLLNNDAYLKEKDFVENACAFMKERKDCSALGPEITDADGKLQNPYYKSFPGLATEFLSLSGLLPVYNFFNRNKYFYTREGLAHYEKGSNVVIVSHLCGSCMLMRRKAIEDVGLLDEEMFFYREDMDISYRMRKKGWKIFVLPYITAIHEGTGSWEKAPFSVQREAIKSFHLFFKKIYGKRQYSYMRLIHFVTSFPRILIYPVRPRSFYMDIFRYSLMGVSLKSHEE